jgi:uncharacterized protein (TIGR02217 family)
MDDVRLPEEIERGAQGGPGFKTSIVTLASGAEQRNQDWQIARSRWDIGYGIRKRSDLQAVLNFFYARRGKLRAFRFRDWLDFSIDGEPVGEGTTATRRQLVKKYSDTEGINDYTRVITLPVAETLKVYVDNLALDPGDFTLLPNGVLLFEEDPGENVKASFEFDVPVRFDIDELPVTLNTYTEGAISGIGIVEVRL